MGWGDFDEKDGVEVFLKEIWIAGETVKSGIRSLSDNNEFYGGVWCGANRFEHLEVTRQDRTIEEIFGWKRMAGHKAYLRYFRKFGERINNEAFEKLFGWFFKGLKFDNYTLDLDSTVITRYGDQEGAKRGYNDKKRGRKSHHPLMAFLSDIRMVANIWLRQGDTHSANNFFVL